MSVEVYNLKAIPEVTPGTTPVDSNLWFWVPVISESLSGEIQAVQSQVVSSSREPYGQVLSGFNAQGNINTELKFGYYDAFFESCFGNQFAADLLTIGNNDYSFSFEREYNAQSRFAIMTGFRCTSIQINAQYGQLVALNMGFMGHSANKANATAVGAGSVTAESGNRSMNSTSDLQNLTIDGSGAHGLIIQGLDLTINNNAQQKNSIGSIYAFDVAQLAADITGTFTMYVTQAGIDQYENILSNTPIALVYQVTDGTNTYEIQLPELYITGSLPVIEGRNTVPMQTLNFTAAYNSAAGHAIRIDRAP